jgi:hypothetical protein
LAAFFIFAVSLAVFGLQLRTLYSVPVFDSARWGGDESWLMREYVNQMEHGVLLYPEYFGGEKRMNGVLAGSIWGNSFLFGLPGMYFFPRFDYVSIGRTVNAVLAFFLLASVYGLCRAVRVSPLLSSVTVAFLVLSQAFVWATHSARYDLLTGLVLVWYCYYLSRIERLTLRSSFLVGVLGIFSILFSPHLLTLCAAATLALFLLHAIWKQPKAIAAWLAGILVAIGILSLAYRIGAGEVSLFGHGGTSGIFNFVIRDIPILRPFSRNVQISNLQERFHIATNDVPGLLLLIGLSILFLGGYKFMQFRMKRHHVFLRIATAQEQRFFLLASLLSTLSWLLLEGSRPYYLFHIIPMLAVGFAIILQFWNDIFSTKWFGTTAAIGAMVLAILLDVSHAIPSPVFGATMQRDQSSVLARFLPELKNDGHKARVLCDVAVLDRALCDTSHAMLTLDMFQPPAEPKALVSKLYANKIDYVILRSSPLGSAFEPGRALIPHVLDSIGILQDSTLGFFYDDGRNYDETLTELIDQGLDTLRLYRVNP